MEYEAYIRKIKRDAYIFLILVVLSLLLAGIGLEILIDGMGGIWFLPLSLCFAIGAVIWYRRSMIYTKAQIYDGKPFVIPLGSAMTYEMVFSTLERSAANKEYFEFSENAAFFRLKRKHKIRTILYRTADFDKKEFDDVKKKINRKANQLYSFTEWVSRDEAAKMMRVNLIFADTMNAELLQYVSIEASGLLARNEGIMSLVICDNKLIVPPLEPTVMFAHIYRHASMVKLFIDLFHV